MTRTKRNPPIRIEGENVILGYDHIALYMNSKNKVVNINQQLAEKLAAECGRRVEGAGLVLEAGRKLMWLYGLGTARTVWFKVGFHIYIDSVVLNCLCM